LNPDKSCKPRVLVVTPRFPYPVVGGDRLRIYEVCKELSKYCSLTLLSLCESKYEIEFEVPDDGVFTRVERFYLSTTRSRVNSLLSIFSSRPLQVSYYWSKSFLGLVEREAEDHDLCIGHLVRTAEYLRRLEKPKILEMTDAISLNYERVKAQTDDKSFRSMVYSFESGRLKKYEVGVSCEFDASFVVSEIDRISLLNNGACENIFVASNGVDVLKYGYEKRDFNSKVIAFIGNLYSHQNLDAVRYFAHQVLPLLRAHGNFVFRIIGRVYDQNMLELEALDGVEVKGNVENVSEAVGDACVAVAPIRLGAGVQNKVLEYMALGLPAIISPTALEGFDLEPGKHLLVAKNASEYCEHIVNLVEDSGMRVRIAEEARRYVEKNQSWEAHLAPFRDLVLNMVKHNV